MQHTWTNFKLILGPVFNLVSICYFGEGGAETPTFIVFSARNAKCRETQKREKTTLFVKTTVLTVLVKMSVFFFFFLHFSFLLFLQFPFFKEMFLIGFQKSNKTK